MNELYGYIYVWTYLDNNLRHITTSAKRSRTSVELSVAFLEVQHEYAYRPWQHPDKKQENTLFVIPLKQENTLFVIPLKQENTICNST